MNEDDSVRSEIDRELAAWMERTGYGGNPPEGGEGVGVTAPLRPIPPARPEANAKPLPSETIDESE